MAQSRTLAINEIFYSIQGESTWSGRPCVFVRLQGCPLRCTWCDTAYAFNEGQRKAFDEIFSEIEKFPCRLVELTGGEPLSQPECFAFAQELVDRGWTVMTETSGAFSIEKLPKEVKVIMDIKAPGSGESSRNFWDNLAWLKPGIDEVKFVISDKNDFEFAHRLADEKKLLKDFTVLMSPVHGKLAASELAEWIKDSAEDYRLQLQIHKFIWEEKARGV